MSPIPGFGRSQRGRVFGSESGAIILFVALGLVVLVGMLGLAIDVGHAYVNKSHLQNIADACALAGASALNGTAAGIVQAEARATDTSSFLDNRTEFNKDAVTIPTSAVAYSAVSPDGPWITDRGTAEGVASTIRYVRVVVPPRDSEIIFAKVVPGIPAALNFGARAVAGRQPVTDMCNGLDPFCPIALDLNDPVNFGYQLGQVYSVRLDPGNSQGGGMGSSCSDYGLPGSVTGNFGLSDPSNRQPSLTVFSDNLLHGNYNSCVPISPNAMDATTGNMGNAALQAIRDRFNQDTNTTVYTQAWPSGFNAYMAANPNYRRIIRVAFNDQNIPNGSGRYTVMGFGCFWMPVIPDASPPSAAICFVYIGGCDTSGMPTGNSASITRTVLFR